MTALTLGGSYGSPVGIWRSTRPGVSDAATVLRKFVAQAFDEFTVSATGQARYSGPSAQLIQLYEDCRLADWDQEGADPITLATLGSAQKLLYALPAHVSLPEFLPEPNGRIAFEWHKGKGNVYVLSAGASNQLEFAGLFGPVAEVHGKCSFTDALPDMVLDHLKELFRR